MFVDAFPWVMTHSLVFLILVWFFKRNVWGPVLRLLDERREAIQKQFAEVEALKAEAEKTREDYKAQLHQAQAEARDLVQKAKSDATALAEQLRAETQAALEKSRKDASDRIAQETENARTSLRQYAAGLAVMVAEKFLTEGLSAEQRRRITEETLPEIERAATKN
ncbi:MAG: ATP synthase subunit b [bacterium]|nr:ATP synthase subunit b [bacterium]